MGPLPFAVLVFLFTTSVTLVLLMSKDRGEEPQDPPENPTGYQMPRVPLEGGEWLAEEERFIQIFQHVAPSVVHVDAVGTSLHTARADEIPPPDVGTGFIWSDRGHIVTSYHVVVNRGPATSVTLADGSRWSAEWVGASIKHDLAVLSVGAPRDLLQPIQVGTSANLRIGQRVLAIGNPYGLDHTLSVGVLSGVDRTINGLQGSLRGVIQTDAAIHPGNSGGPLLNSSGQLIGINTAVIDVGRPGVGFAVPVDVINREVREIIRHGFNTWHELGISIAGDDISQGMLEQVEWHEKVGREFGLIVIEVKSDSPAEEAGMVGAAMSPSSVHLGDIIVGVDDNVLTTREELTRHLSTLEAGDPVRLNLIRGEEPLDVDLVFAERPRTPGRGD